MDSRSGSEIIAGWPEESREAAQLVIEAYGEPQEATPTVLTWFDVGPWKRVLASKVFYEHRFPAPHNDSVESVIDYRVPPEKFSELAQFDGSVILERTVGEASARCHDEQANFLALNLMHDIVTGQKDVAGAREYYAKEFGDARRKRVCCVGPGPGGGGPARTRKLAGCVDLEPLARTPTGPRLPGSGSRPR